MQINDNISSNNIVDNNHDSISISKITNISNTNVSNNGNNNSKNATTIETPDLGDKNLRVFSWKRHENELSDDNSFLSLHHYYNR